jgi:Ser/Thr protein kinase RdoA (MazF antagonist)
MKLDPHAQFEPTFDNLTAIISQYGLLLRTFELAKSGIENCTVFIETNKGAYVLRVYRQAKKTHAEIELEISFINYLHEHTIPVAAPINNQAGESVTQITALNKEWQAILMPVMGGVHAEHYSTKLIHSLATLQAKMHKLASGFKYTSGPKVRELRESYFINLIENRHALDPIRAGFVDRAENYLVSLEGTLPSGLCHLDYDNGNVLSYQDVVTAVLDFDDLADAPFVMCLAYTVWDVLFDTGLDGLREYVSAYEKHRPLHNTEQKMLLPIVLFRHYVIGCKDIADGQMNDELLSKYIELEDAIMASII